MNVSEIADRIFPLQAHYRHVRRVVTGAEFPDGLMDPLRRAGFWYEPVLSIEECGMDVFVERQPIPPWKMHSGRLGDPSSWTNGLGEPLYLDAETGKFVSENDRYRL